MRTTHYTAQQHPSLPNYFAVLSGSTQGASTDCGTNTNLCATPEDNIFHQLEASGGSWQGMGLSRCRPTVRKPTSSPTSYTTLRRRTSPTC